jgi:nitric oxide reductase NorE protein
MSSEAQSRRHLPGEAGIWVFIFGDILVFSLFFSTYLYYRRQDLALFVSSQARLDQGLGVLNTLLMLSSSWFVATAVQTARRQGRNRTTPWCLALAFLCGAGFVVVKYFEYGAKIRAGFTLNSNDFYMYYYMFTGIHLLHVLIGMGVLLYLQRLASAASYGDQTLRNLESGGSFWHVVDLLWIVLFALFYLVK